MWRLEQNRSRERNNFNNNKRSISPRDRFSGNVDKAREDMKDGFNYRFSSNENNNNNKHFLSLLLTHSKLCSNSISTRRCRYKNSVKHLKQFLWNFREYFFPSSSSHKQQRRQYSKNFMRLCHPNCYRFLLSHHLTSIEFLCINVRREIEKYWDWFSYFPHLVFFLFFFLILRSTLSSSITLLS